MRSDQVSKANGSFEIVEKDTPELGARQVRIKVQACGVCQSDSFIKQDNNNHCWICKQKEDAFPNKLKIFKTERLKQKELGNNSKQLALKILINVYMIHLVYQKNLDLQL